MYPFVFIFELVKTRNFDAIKHLENPNDLYHLLLAVDWQMLV